MKQTLVLISSVLLSLMLLTGCKSFGKDDAGLLIGGAAGGAAGHALTDHPAGTTAGAVGGAYAGKKIGEDM